MAMPTTRPTRGRGNLRGAGTGPAGGMGSLTSRPVEDEPDEQRREEPEARIDQDERAQMRLEPDHREKLAARHGEDHAHRHADDPGGEERSLDVDDGITAGGGDARGGDERGDLTTSIGHDTLPQRLGVRATRRPARGILAALAFGGVLGASGCSQLPFSAAWDPFAAAPPTPVAPWRASDGSKQPRLAVLIDRLNKEVQIDPDKEYGLADLIDLAQRLNPETWRAWEEARAAAARLGRSESAWFPALAATAAAGTSRTVEKAGAGLGGAVPVTGPEATPTLQLSWILLDFGRRSAAVEQAGWDVMTANLHFNRKHQDVAFGVSESFFAL